MLETVMEIPVLLVRLIHGTLNINSEYSLTALRYQNFP